MSLPDPFAYPVGPHEPAHAPAGYADYGGYKPWLRDDFRFRCVYCLTRERWYSNGHHAFGADHVVPQALSHELVASYSNLVYACNTCNSLKGTQSALNPFREPLAEHLVVHADGSIHALTPQGGRLIELLDLSSPARDAERADKFRAVRIKLAHPDDTDIDQMYRQAFGYPDDLPDLLRRDPREGNIMPGSENNSHHARRARGELPEVY